MNIKVGSIYLLVVLIWSTTPLAIQWSNSSVGFLAAVSARMLFASILCALMLVFMKKRLIQHPQDWKAMIAGAVGLFPNMALVYWSAQFIPSGLVSVLLGVYPFLVGIFSIIILKQNPFNISRVIALIIAVLGLVFIHVEQMALGEQAVYGVMGIVVSAVFFALSTVWLKQAGGGVEPIRQLSGTLFIATPFFLVSWFLFGEPLPTSVDMRSIIGITYLVIAGSLGGGLAFYYVLRHCSVSTVSLIPLMTPLLAMLFGYYLEGESLNRSAVVGSGLILLSLAVYQGVINSGYIFVKRTGCKLARVPALCRGVLVAKLEKTI